MKKKRFWLFVALLLVGFMGMHSQKVEAAPWGAKKLYTTPVAARGTWYYKERGKIKSVKITKHTFDGKKMYYRLPLKEESKYYYKWVYLSNNKRDKVSKYLEQNMIEVIPFKWHGLNSFGLHIWLIGNGSGDLITPMNRIRHGKKVRVLRFGYGAGNWLVYYAYKSPELVK